MVEESWLETNFNEDYEINSLIVDVDGYEGLRSHPHQL